MKILMINHHPRDVLGGSEIQCDLIATYLTRLGHKVIYFAVRGKQKQYDTVYRVEPGRLNWRDLWRIVSTDRPDLVYWRFNKRKLLPSVVFLKLMRVKIVFSISHINDVIKWSHKVRGDANSLGERIRKWSSFIRSALSSRVNHFGYYWVDGVIAQLQQQTGKLPVQKEQVIYNSMDGRIIPFHWKKPFIVWVASLKRTKNPEVFIELSRNLQEMNVDCLMIGRIQQSCYRVLLQDPGLPSNFNYLGVKQFSEVNGILQKSLFLVHTCHPEGLPNVFIQAWMQGKPTISLYYDPDDMIQNHNIGYLSRNFEQLVKDTKVLIDNKMLREEMGQRARMFAEKCFNPKKNIRKFEAFFKEICAKEENNVQ